MWPDIENVLIDYLAGLADDAGGSTPGDLTGTYLRVERIGGGNDRVTDAGRVDVEAFASTRDQAFSIARAAQQRLEATPYVVGGVVVDLVDTIIAPTWRPWSNTAVKRAGGTYTVHARRMF